ncbi:hypothetical protein KDH10_003476 [Shewanella vesiculosa]|nr:hypothetical protein [Shewanella vesiculosa]UJL42315.1 hypothetical protein KDH10_003476 [Shewanella vesiculosa]
MYNTAKKQVWFGELRTSKGNTIVVHDNQLPQASPGRIYFYNTIRNTIVEYVEDIVKVNLHDLDDEQTKAAIAEFNDAWKAARAEFMLKHQSRIDLSKVPDTAPRKAKPVPEPDEVIDSDDDIPEFDDSDDDDDSFDEIGDSIDD